MKYCLVEGKTEQIFNKFFIKKREKEKKNVISSILPLQISRATFEEEKISKSNLNFILLCMYTWKKIEIRNRKLKETNNRNGMDELLNLISRVVRKYTQSIRNKRKWNKRIVVKYKTWNFCNLFNHITLESFEFKPWKVL